MTSYNLVSQSNLDTVIAHYQPSQKRASAFQSEAQLEAEFINMLVSQGYSYTKIHNEHDLIANLRTQLETLNHYAFSDSEWQRLFAGVIAVDADGVKGKTSKIQDTTPYTIDLDNGQCKNFILIDKANPHNNILQVINQYSVPAAQGARRNNRYDVTILVNGLPLVHIELKRRGVSLREAFNQIDRYTRDSFSAGHGLFEYVQIFVISNGTETKYYSGTTRLNAEHDNMSGTHSHDEEKSSFEFTSYWADAENNVIADLVDFTQTFFARRTLLNILTKYCVFTTEQQLLVMRPYQITASEAIISRIKTAHNYNFAGSVKAGGYIWHITGSGKTLTSFKTAQIASRLEGIDKVLFVVDRKDLDYQTVKEYDRFEKGAADSNSSTAVLKRQLENPKARIIITTIQKLSRFIGTNKGHTVYSKHVVIIFDECHRSQFGDMHSLIKRNFKKHYIFGFTGTPIVINETAGGLTTQMIFGDELHKYTLLHAIRDKNVLPFRVDYMSTMHEQEDIEDEKVRDIDRENAYNAPQRIELIVRYILDHFDQKTYGKFNAMFAVSSIKSAMLYYDEFKRLDTTGKLRIAVIFSHAAKEGHEEAGGLLDDENPEDTSGLSAGQREFLGRAIDDYNAMFQANYDTSGGKFQNYYKDVSKRVKERELDLLIVVNMFLTGFDAPCLNTLWVDKNLKMHGLIQAFSRTNRIVNSVKVFGNIVCFRKLRARVNEAVRQFGTEEAQDTAIMRPFDDYYNGYTTGEGLHIDGYAEMISELVEKFPVSEMITGEERQREFIGLFGAVLKMRNLLRAFDDFDGRGILSKYDYQDYTSRYLDLREEWMRKRERGEVADINDDLVFELELISQEDINVDYIMMLAGKYKDTDCSDKEILIKIQKAVDASPELRSKKQLIATFLEGIADAGDVLTAWREHVRREWEKDISALVKDENLKAEGVRNFIDASFRNGYVKTTGEEISKFMPSLSLFDVRREEKKQGVIRRIQTFFEKYRGA